MILNRDLKITVKNSLFVDLIVGFYKEVLNENHSARRN